MSRDSETDVVIIGAGPIGIETAVGLKEAGVGYVHFEAGQIAQTIYNWPPDTRFLSSPEWITIAGFPIQTPVQDILFGEQYLAYLRSIVEFFDLDVRTYERVVAVERLDAGFLVTTERRGERFTTRAEKIIFATGDMVRPNSLGIPGEHLPHVSHRLEDPHKFFRTRHVVIGGKNSALEAAVRSWRNGANVTICYRRDRIDPKRVFSRLYLDVKILLDKGLIEFRGNTVPTEITPTVVRVAGPAGAEDLAAEFVTICTGYRADLSLLAGLGVATVGRDRKPVLDPATNETSVPGVYVVGTATGGDQSSYRVFIGTSHGHVRNVVRAVSGGFEPRWGDVPTKRFAITTDDLDAGSHTGERTES